MTLASTRVIGTEALKIHSPAPGVTTAGRPFTVIAPLKFVLARPVTVTSLAFTAALAAGPLISKTRSGLESP